MDYEEIAKLPPLKRIKPLAFDLFPATTLFIAAVSVVAIVR